MSDQRTCPDGHAWGTATDRCVYCLHYETGETVRVCYGTGKHPVEPHPLGAWHLDCPVCQKEKGRRE